MIIPGRTVTFVTFRGSVPRERQTKRQPSPEINLHRHRDGGTGFAGAVERGVTFAVAALTADRHMQAFAG